MRFFILLAFLTLPIMAFAYEPFTGSLVPACTEGGYNGLCQACNAVQLVSNLLRFMVMLGIAGASLMFAYAGILAVTASANKSNLDSARKIFWNSFLGLIFILAAFLIIDLVLRTFVGGQSFNVFTRIECVRMAQTSGQIQWQTVPSADGSDGGVSPGPSSGPAGEGEGLQNVDSNTNYNPAICRAIANYEDSGPGASCTRAARDANSRVDFECQQGCVDSSNGQRIITAQDYKYCQDNPGGSLVPIEQSFGWQDFGAMPCSQVQGVTVATPQGSGIPRGQRFTWPELARRYGLPDDTVFIANDSYGNMCGSRRCGYTDRGTYSIDLARCIEGCTLPNNNSSRPMLTKPTPVPGN